MVCFKWLKTRVIQTSKRSDNGKLKITDLKVHCLENIFQKLDLNDLLNVAESNKYFKEAAGMAFRQRYGAKKVWLNKPRLLTQQKLCVYSANIIIEDVKTSLRILRSFGGLITKLEITENKVSSDWEFTDKFGVYQIIYNTIMSYVNQFCAKTLKEFALVMVPKTALNQLKNPFISLKTLNLFSCHLSKELLPLDELFPNIQNLILNFNEIDDATVIEEHWPCLKHFEVNIDRHNIQKKHVEEILCLNPQLQSLKISSGWDADILRSASKFLQLIECLEIGNHFGGFSTFTGDMIHFIKLKTLKISIIGTQPGPLCTIPLSFEQLEDFTLETNHEINETFFEFLRQNPTINKLTIPALSDKIQTLENDRFEFSKELINLIELDLNRFTFNANQAIGFISELKSLKKFQFKIDTCDEYDNLLVELNSGWQASIDCYPFVNLEYIPIESFVNYIHNFLDNLQFRQVYHY